MLNQEQLFAEYGKVTLQIEMLQARKSEIVKAIQQSQAQETKKPTTSLKVVDPE